MALNVVNPCGTSQSQKMGSNTSDLITTSAIRRKAGCLDMRSYISCPNCIRPARCTTWAHSYCCALMERVDDIAVAMPLVAIPGLHKG